MDRKKGGLKKLLDILSRYKYVMLVVALGALLLLWPGDREDVGEDETVHNISSGLSLRDTEEAMEEILGRIQGVGRVDVMLTLQSGSELILAEDTSLRYSGSVQAPDDYQRTSDAVLADGGVVVRQERYPQYRGALIVCDGGGNDTVRLRVVEAVSALTGLGADRIAVVQWQGTASNGTS